MADSVGGSIAAGIQGGWQMGLQSDAAAEHRREFDQEETLRKEAQDRMLQQEQDRYGRMNDQARITALTQRQATLETLGKSAAVAGHSVPDSVQQEWARNAIQLEDMQQQIVTTGRLAPQSVGLGASMGSQAPLPPPNVASAGPSGYTPAPANAPVPTPAPPPQPFAAPPVNPARPTGAGAPLPGAATAGAPPAAGLGGGMAPGTPTGTDPAAPNATGAPAAPAMGVAAALGAAPPAGPSPGGTTSATAGLGIGGVGTDPGAAGPATPAAAPAPAMPGAAPATGAISSPTTSAVTPAQQTVADGDQASQDLASKLHTGQLSLSDVAPGDFALMMASATKRAPTPDDLAQVRQHINDWQSGMATGNSGLTLQGLNGIYGPQVNLGVGNPSPYGGTITGKSIIGLDPAMSADGTVHTDKVIPRLQVTTDVKGADGTPLTYHAPMTQNRSTDPNDPVTAVPMADAVNNIGALGALVTAAQHPAAQAMLAQGAADPRVAAYLQSYKDSIAPPDPAAAQVAMVNKYMAAWGTDWDTTVGRLQDAGIMKMPIQPRGALNTLQAAQQLADEQGIPLGQAFNMVDPKRYRAGAANVPVPGAGGFGLGAAGGNLSLTGDDYLKTLPAAVAKRVQNIAADPEMLKNVPETKGQRAAMADMVKQYAPDTKLGAASGASARSQQIYNRVLTGAEESVADLGNIAELPANASVGWFGSVKPGTTLLTAPMSVLTNKLSSQDVQSYNVLSSGFQRNLASIETSGLAPTGAFVDQLAKLNFSETDTQYTKMQKLAQIRQVVEQGLKSTMNDPKFPPAQLAQAQDLLAKVRSVVPYTQHDLTALKSRWQNGDEGATINDVVAKNPAAAPPTAGGMGLGTASVPKPGGKLVYNPATGGFN